MQVLLSLLPFLHSFPLPFSFFFFSYLSSDSNPNSPFFAIMSETTPAPAAPAAPVEEVKPSEPAKEAAPAVETAKVEESAPAPVGRLLHRLRSFLTSSQEATKAEEKVEVRRYRATPLGKFPTNFFFSPSLGNPSSR